MAHTRGYSASLAAHPVTIELTKAIVLTLMVFTAGALAALIG